MNVSWNITGSLSKIKASDTVVLSVGKSGRTWLRVMLNKYLSLTFGVPFGLEDLNKSNGGIPSIAYTHELWEHISKATTIEKLMGKYIIPESVLSAKKVIVLYRDPRDVLISLYFHKTRRSRKKARIKTGDLINDRRCGIQCIIEVLNNWRHRLKNHSGCFWISYETLRRNTLDSLLNILTFIGFSEPDEELMRQAVRFSEFDNMKQMEAKGLFESRILQPGNPTDPDSFKVRAGKVGGYLLYFSTEELCVLNRALEGLDEFYGYKTISE